MLCKLNNNVYIPNAPVALYTKIKNYNFLPGGKPYDEKPSRTYS